MLFGFQSQKYNIFTLASFEVQNNNNNLTRCIHFRPLKGKNKSEEEGMSKEKGPEKKDIPDMWTNG